MFVKSALDAVAGWVQAVDESRADDEAVLLDIKRSVQADDWSCGAQSAFMILRYFGKARSVTAVVQALGTDRDGTSVRQLLDLFRRRRLRPVIMPEATPADLRRGIDEGAPAVVSLDDGGHWGVVYGYAPDTIYLADPSLRRAFRVAGSTESFCRRWDRWAMVVRRR